MKRRAIGSIILACALIACGDRSGERVSNAVPVSAQAEHHDPGACGQSKIAASALQSRDWISTNEPLYWVDAAGRLFVDRFDRSSPRVLLQRPITFAPSLYVSSDRRWLLYMADVDGTESEEGWLVDTRGNAVRKVWEKPKFGSGIPAISPNGTMIAIYRSYDDRWPSGEGIGLYLIQTERDKTDFLGGIASTAIPPEEIHASPSWAAHGETVLVHAVGHPRGTFTREFHAFSVATGRFRQIDGRYPEPMLEEFFENGSKIAVQDEPGPRSAAYYEELRSPNGSLLASVDEDFQLFVETKDNRRMPIDHGSYSKCEGITIAIHGWVDDEHFVYGIGGTSYFVEATTGRRSILFSDQDKVSVFTWQGAQ